MKNYEKKILDERLKDFRKEVIPVELFPYLSSLQKTDKEFIEARQKNEGPTRANDLLVDRLKRRHKGFQDFVQALRKCGFEHTALLLDPYFNYPVDTEDDETADADGPGVGFKMIGTAIDVTIKGNLLLQNSEEQPEECSELETYLAKKFKDHSSAESKKMRKELQKHLPQGAVFVNTAKRSIIATFRLSSEQAAKKLWEMYSEGKFQTMLQTVLVENTLKEDEKVADKPALKLNLSLVEDHFNQIQEKLAEIESKQEVEDSLLSTSTSEQEDNTGDDGSEHEIEIDIPPVYLGSDANSFILELREYQKELAAPAIEGKNTIICAPTNVAIEIAKKHLDAGIGEAGGNTTKEPRVVFIVSTVNLVLQQKERFKNFLGDKYPVGKISGANSTEIPLKYLLKNHKVVVMTAPILVNALNSKNKEERVQLCDISLLLFDECHHVDKEHSYNQIMERYLALKKQAGTQHRLPQIVGFTASLGTGKAQSVEKAEKHILLNSANLDAEIISTVKKNEEELKKYANVPKREIFHAPNTSQDLFVKIVSQVMDKIEALIKRVKGESHNAGPTDKAGQHYRQWVEVLYKDSIEEGDRFLVTFAEQLREYHVALAINASTTMKNAKNRLQRYFDSLNEDKFLPIDKKLKDLFQCAMKMLEKHVKENGEPENPLLMHLKEMLLNNYKDVKPQQEKDRDGDTSKDDGANEVSQQEDGTGKKNLENKKDTMTSNGPKGILFTRTRESTEALLDWIKESKELNDVLRPEKLVGSGDVNSGMTQHDQERVINRFHTGEKNLLLATSVAEEGLDIRDCNYVIRYDMMGNEISTVQSRGRVRPGRLLSTL
ncbi:ATP-dependent RNA helicase DHX58-like [Oculina patagonica]